MSMVVQHNLQAMNANRLLGITSGQQSKSTEKLSSGYRINRAADDAAGLTISEKMRRQIRGLSQASTNAQDGVSSVQTAEGALTEVHSMLQRMNELAVQASNGTQSQNDRDAIQAEIDQLSTEIDRVAETTKFNEIYLLKGDKDTKTVKMAAHDAGLKGTLTDNGDGTAKFVMDALKAGDSVNIGGKNYKIIADANQTEAEAGTGKDYEIEGTKAKTTLDLTGWAAGDTISIGGKAYAQSGTLNTASAVADAIQADLGDEWVVSADATTNVLTIEAAEAGEKDAIVIDTITVNGAAATPTATAGTTTGVKANNDLYAEDGTKALTADEILEAVKNGKDLFTTPGAGSASQSKKVTADDYLVEGTKAKTTLDLTGWTGGDTISIGSKAYAQSATLNTASAVADAIQADLGDEWVVSADNTTNILTIEAAKNGEKDAIVIDTITVGGATTATPTATAGTTTGVTVDKPVYAKGGTEALTAEKIQAAYDNNEPLYFDKAERADNEITITEAYKLAKDELLKANQIGDMNQTATVTFGTADGGSKEKTEADYAVGDSVTIGGTAYTIAYSEDEAKTAVTDAITAATGLAATPANNNNTTNLTVVGSVSDGTTTINIFKHNDGSLRYADNNTATSMTHQQAGNTAIADKTAADVEALVAAGATVTFTPDAGVAGAATVAAAVADDDTAGSTTISAAKAAELENAAAGGDDAAEGTPGPVFNITTASADVAKTLSFNLHVGADADMTNKIQVDIDTMNSAFLGIKDLNVSDEGGMSATYAIDAIQDAISKVSAQRSALGAIQNRLEHTISNLDNVVENTTSAESRIRDTDMASEMVEYSKNNILAQAGQAMLAQANQSTQGVLSLLG